MRTTSKDPSSNTARPFQIELDHVDAAPHTGRCTSCPVDLDAIPAATAFALQQVKQCAVTAAKIQHARLVNPARPAAAGFADHSWRNPFKVGAHHRQIPRVVQQERVVPVRCIDLGVTDPRRLSSNAFTISGFAPARSASRW